MFRRKMERTEVKILFQGIFSLLCSWTSRKVILLCVEIEQNYLWVLVVWNQNSIPLPRNLFLQMEQICQERTKEGSAPQWLLPKQLSLSAETRHLGIKFVFHLEHGRGFKQLTRCVSSAHIQTSRNLDPPWIKWQLSS